MSKKRGRYHDLSELLWARRASDFIAQKKRRLEHSGREHSYAYMLGHMGCLVDDLLTVCDVNRLRASVDALNALSIAEHGVEEEITKRVSRRLPRSEEEAMSLDVRLMKEDGDEVWWRNITHNLTTMAEEAGLYGVMWRPDENGIDTARQMIEPLTNGLRDLSTDPERFRTHNPSNGWGSYERLMDFVGEYLLECIKNPNARVSVSR